MKTKRAVLEYFAEHSDCEGIECKLCPYRKSGRCSLPKDLKRIGAMALLRQNPKKREFDPSKILTCVTADKARVGMRGYFADDLVGLKTNFKNNAIYRLLGIYEEDCTYRFESEHNEYALFYPIDKVEE